MKKHTILFIAIVLLGISIIATPFILNMEEKSEKAPEATISVEENTETTEIVIETTESTEVITEPVEETIVPTIEATIPPVEETETIPDETEIVDEPTVEETEVATEPVETTPKTVISEVPLYNQWDYPDVYYGERPNVTVATHGDGMTTMAMIATYLKDDPTLTPDVIANNFGYHDSNQGTSWALFTDAAEVLELGEVRQAWDWNVGEIEKALREGSIVACCLRKSIFSENGGRYILLTGITEDGKIMVNDSNGYNYDSSFLKPMFRNGFDAKYIYEAGSSYWIYPPKNA